MMITEDLQISTGGRPIDASAMYGAAKPDRAFLILPGKGYTVNHFLLDFIWRMAAEAGFYAIKAEYRGYTYRHLNEPYDHEHAAEDVGYVIDFLTVKGYPPEKTIVCAKSLGTIALATYTANRDIILDKAVLLTPVLYFRKDDGVFPVWAGYSKKVKNSYLVFGSNDPYCDTDSAKAAFPAAPIDCYPGADHGLHLEGDYARTIEIQREIIEKVKQFII